MLCFDIFLDDFYEAIFIIKSNAQKHDYKSCFFKPDS